MRWVCAGWWPAPSCSNNSYQKQQQLAATSTTNISISNSIFNINNSNNSYNSNTSSSNNNSHIWGGYFFLGLLHTLLVQHGRPHTISAAPTTTANPTSKHKRMHRPIY